jgi:hypothetical protein
MPASFGKPERFPRASGRSAAFVKFPDGACLPKPSNIDWLVGDSKRMVVRSPPFWLSSVTGGIALSPR